jgi:5'-nucleotidase
MKILITNDDGVDAPGLLALQQVAARLGDTIIVAPHQPISGTSHQVTTDVPIRVAPLATGKNSVSGTPVDCVRIALLQMGIEADWVLSGINDGGNLGVDTLMSGTVGAAREAALLGRKAIAFSQYMRRQLAFDWVWAARLTERILPQLMRRPLPARSFWNVNLPHEADYQTASPDIVFCPLDPHPLPVSYEQIAGAYHYRSDYHSRKRRPGTDVDICFNGRVAVSLVSLEQA